jgi:integrase
MALTSLQVKNLKSQEKDFFLADERGLRLLVKTGGGKYWRFKYRFDGKQKTLSLGTYPDVLLKDARALRDLARNKIASGIDPSTERRNQKLERKRALGNSFAMVAKEWWELQKDTWTEKHRERVWGRLENNAFKSIGSLPLEELKPQLIVDAVKVVETRGSLDVAKRLLQDINRILDYAVQTGRIDYNPAASLSGIVKPTKVKHRPSLPPELIPQFMEDLSNYPEKGRFLTQQAIYLLLYTFVRPGELRFAEWSEFDVENALWRIPAYRMKMKTEHLVPLSRQAIDTLEAIWPISGKYQFLFPSERSRLKAMSENTMGKALRVMGYDGTDSKRPRITPHGFRATASSCLNEKGFSPDAIERQLSHIERNAVRSAYTHHARFLDERHELMQWWADKLCPSMSISPEKQRGQDGMGT